MSASIQVWEHLYRRHRHRALRLARRVLRDSGEAEDVVQEVFARLLCAPVSFAGRARASTWLHRVVLNRSLSALRARARRLTLHSVPAAVQTPEDDAASRERGRHFLEAWHRLSERDRALVWMRDLEGLDYRTIAARLATREGTVKSALHRARARLQRHLAVLGISD